MRVELHTRGRTEFVDVTGHVNDAVRSSGVAEGVAVVYCPHTTAGVTVNEHADPDVMRDIQDWLDDAVPRGRGWRHAEGNADGHVKAALIGSSVTIPLSGGRLALGTWQGVFFCEFDGPRTRHLEVRVLPG
jgi:secondary thiamine-phosphate synthase enzyme